jgi:hypothetical protein
MTDRTPERRSKLPSSLRALAIVDFAVVLGVGGFGLFLLIALMPYGRAIPSAMAVYVLFGLRFVLVPAVLTAGVVAAGRGLYLRGSHRLGAALFFLPLIGMPVLLMQMAL